MNQQMNVVATACIGGIIVAFTWMFDIFPIWCTLGFLVILGYVAFASPAGKRKPPPSEPWYMK
jgi:hypothetical protein